MLPPTVTVVRGAATDPAALTALTVALQGAGVRVQVTDRPESGPLTVYLGGATENPATADVLATLSAGNTEGLPAEGYVLATGSSHGRQLVALAGVDPTGTFYAVQSFRQLLSAAARSRLLPVVHVRDWPAAQVRGTIEGFYGTPWSHASRLDQLDFYGQHKMNTYEYSPKDDPYLRERWRDLYPADKLADLKELVDRANANHVRLTYALSPGLSVCYSSETDIATLIAKFEQVYAIGVRAFDIPLDDISYTNWNCPADATKFGTGGAAAGAAQSYLLNRINQDFIAKHSDVRRLETVATEYYSITDSPYKTALREQLDKNVIVMWTGTAVIPTTITVAQTKTAEQVFGHDMLLWDNYPVNDYMRGRTPMSPYLGRQDGVASAQVGIVANPMNQAAASKVDLFGVADFAWNDTGFDPRVSWLAGAYEYAHGNQRVVDALRWYADAENWMQTIDPVEAPRLAAAVSAFWSAWQHDDQHGIAVFQQQVRDFAQAPTILRAGLEPAFATETGPWLDAMTSWGQAMKLSLDMLRAQRSGDGARAWADRQQIPALVAAAAHQVDPIDGTTHVKVANTVADAFVRDALATNDRWFGLSSTASWSVTGGPAAASGSSLTNVTDRNLDTSYVAAAAPVSGDALVISAASAAPLSAVLVAVPAGRRTAAEVDVRTSGQWQPIGRISSGYAELPVKGLSVDAVRLRWLENSTAPAVAEVVPVPSGVPAALTVDPAALVADAGAQVSATLTVASTALAAVRGRLQVTAPASVTVTPASVDVSVRRGDQTQIPLAVTVSASAPTGAKQLTVTLAGRIFQVPLHIYPHTLGTNVALASAGASATASCVEIDDPSRFGAPFGNDGDPQTRWSSCYDDNAWWTVKLAGSYPLSKVVIQWEASYASAYKLQVSSDGTTWTTVADQSHGSGGVETVRFDPVNASYLRMQGAKRALQWGYSFYELQAYPAG
ncbi:hypothetical protein GCM10009765_07110 [Fodinicola feengrottensis]|uniref:F5/8 type C domain-containing protein n=1 Tax=Fodinicola feengrottensis TaxID=435914 RepID=A0ABN2FV36_9ACTN